LEVDIIVNAANKTLLGGGGVDGQIHRKAGKELLNECKKLGGCETGQSKMTDAYNLPCKKVIHTVGPIYRDGNHNEKEMLKSCYVSSIELAEDYRKENNLKEITIAFPCISTGVYHFPNEEAAKTVVNTLKELNYDNINVILECFLDKDYKIYNELLNDVN
jgi:O-acetyl-ADP-ribose deacetylase